MYRPAICSSLSSYSNLFFSMYNRLENIDCTTQSFCPLLCVDPTLTIKNLCLVTATVGDWYRLGYYDSGLHVPDCVRQMIKENLAYKTEEEKKEALLLYYLRNVPSASWQNVAGVLHCMEEVTALETVNGFWKSPPAGE